LISIPLRSAQLKTLKGCELKILKAERKNRKEGRALRDPTLVDAQVEELGGLAFCQP
jgi:hypothetical protein